MLQVKQLASTFSSKKNEKNKSHATKLEREKFQAQKRKKTRVSSRTLSDLFQAKKNSEKRVPSHFVFLSGFTSKWQTCSQAERPLTRWEEFIYALIHLHSKTCSDVGVNQQHRWSAAPNAHLASGLADQNQTPRQLAKLCCSWEYGLRPARHQVRTPLVRLFVPSCTSGASFLYLWVLNVHVLRNLLPAIGVGVESILAWVFDRHFFCLIVVGVAVFAASQTTHWRHGHISHSQACARATLWKIWRISLGQHFTVLLSM